MLGPDLPRGINFYSSLYSRRHSPPLDEPKPQSVAGAYNKPMAKPQTVLYPYVSPWINEELQLFRKNVKRFIQEEFVPHEARWREQHCRG